MRPLLWAMVLAAALAAGCDMGNGGSPDRPPRPVARVDVIELWAASLRATGTGPATGVGAQVYLYQIDQAQPVSGDGTLKLYVFAGEDVQAEPFAVWTFESPQLRQYQAWTIAGWSYKIPLLWPQRPPAADKVAVIAQFVRRDGRILTSAAASVIVR